MSHRTSRIPLRMSGRSLQLTSVAPLVCGGAQGVTPARIPATRTSLSDAGRDFHGSYLTRRIFASSAVLLMLLVAFAVLPREARSANAQPLAWPPATYGPGWRRTANPDGTVDMTYLRTFQRWDGAWRPATSLNRSTGEWPYQLMD